MNPSAKMWFPEFWKLVFVGMLIWFSSQSVTAGLSPENVIVVVNEKSMVSRTIANHYIDLRRIPTQNVILLPDVPSGLLVDLETFRSKILQPILAELDKRKIAAQSRVIAYSADFPTMVDVGPHAEKLQEPNTKKYQRPIASLTGMTFFYRFVQSDSENYLHFKSNLYARGKRDRSFRNPFAGEQAKLFDDCTKLDADGEFAKAAEAWMELFKKAPTQAPLGILAAKSYVNADQLDKAAAALLQAVRMGWWSAKYLKDDESLAKLVDRPEIKQVMPLLDPLSNDVQGPMGFRTDLGWLPNGYPVPIQQGGVPYLLSCSLAVVHPRGSTLEQAISVLERASESDQSFPKGRFAFSAHAGVRSTTRAADVPDALVYLQELGLKTEYFRTEQPTKAGPLVGLMTGRPTINLKTPQWELVPGSIADNLTSFGGVYNADGHTKLTEFLHAGAAMSSGAVAEPYAIAMKFPLPMMYAYYARGVTAIEAFYLSISSPYQTLIVGDPLTQPFARLPSELVDFKVADEPKNQVQITRRSLGVKTKGSQTVAIDISIEGKLVRSSPAVPTVNVNMPKNITGVFEFRATLRGRDRTNPRVSFTQSIRLAGTHPIPEAKVVANRAEQAAKDLSSGPSVRVSLSCDGADKLELLYLGKPIAALDDEAGEVTVSTEKLGDGPLRFRPIARFDDTVVVGEEFTVRD